MNEIVPPVAVDKPENEPHANYIKEIASAAEYDYPDVNFYMSKLKYENGGALN